MHAEKRKVYRRVPTRERVIDGLCGRVDLHLGKKRLDVVVAPPFALLSRKHIDCVRSLAEQEERKALQHARVFRPPERRRETRPVRDVGPQQAPSVLGISEESRLNFTKVIGSKLSSTGLLESVRQTGFALGRFNDCLVGFQDSLLRIQGMRIRKITFPSVTDALST